MTATSSLLTAGFVMALLPIGIAQKPGAMAAIAPSDAARQDHDSREAGHLQFHDKIANMTGVVRAEGRVLGLGPGYRAWFDAAGVTFGVPSTSPSMEWSVEYVGRRSLEGGSWLPMQSVQPQIVGETVRYDRGSWTESYEVRADGLEQSFTFRDLPPGDGDLVVRARVTTTFSTSAEGMISDGLLFLAPDGRAVSMGGVLGIDASGASIPGEMRFADGWLELTIPDWFVDDAKLPLVLDPLIGSPFSTGHQPGELLTVNWGVSYDASNEVFLVGWTEADSSGPGLVSLGRLVSPTGGLEGPLLCLECDSSYDGTIDAVTNVNARDRFVVWMANYFPVTVSAATGAIRVANLIPTGRSALDWESLGGNATTSDDIIVLARIDQRTGAVLVEQLRVDPNGDITPLQSKQIGMVSSGSPLERVRISKSGGAAGVYLVVWDYQGQIHGAIVDRDLSILGQNLIQPSPESKEIPSVDGNGRRWLVAYRITGTGTGKCVPVFWDAASGSSWTGSERTVVTGEMGTGPSDVAECGESYIVTTAGPVLSSFVAVSVDPFTCLPCEGSMPITASAKLVATQRDSNPSGGPFALLADFAGFSQLYRADDGITADLGGSCGGGGWSAATCARVGNQGFTLRLREAQHAVPAYVAIGVSALGYTCGSCKLVPNPVFVLGVGMTDASHGNAELALPLPNMPSLVGAAFLSQWLTVAGTACPLGLEFSNALRVQLQ